MRAFVFLKLIFISLLVVSCTDSSSSLETPLIQAYDYDIIKELTLDEAAVVSAHPLASEVGAHILKQGGNAIDAAIAVQFSLAVVYPNAGNIGGGGFMVLHTKDGESYSIDFRETAPNAASKDMFLDEEGEVTDKSLNGHLASGVPGTIAGIFLAHEKFGKLPMDKLIEPAITLAELGFSITEAEAKGLNSKKTDFEKYNTKPPVFIKNTDWKDGDTLVQKDLAQTLRRIAKNGKTEFYEGKTAKLIVEEMERGGGIITMDDLKNYQAVLRKTRQFNYKDYSITTMDLPSSGGIMLQQMLYMALPYKLDTLEFHSPEAIQLMVEIERRAYADRTEYMGDPDYVTVPTQQLTDSLYLISRMKDYVPGKAGKSENIFPGLEESEETTHLSIVDKEGNAVAVTTTINTNYGSRVVVGEAGFILNNEMDDFSAKPNAPNAFGLLGTDANAIKPKKRMVSSMTPTIVTKDNKVFMVVGTPGGSTIITSLFQSIVNIIDFKLSPSMAVNAPKFHHQWLPDVVYIEKDFSPQAQTALTAMGYTLEKREPIGRTELILIDEKGKIHAIADKRGDDSAAGY